MKIEELKDSNGIGFHDSGLLSIDLSNVLNEIRIVVCDLYKGDYEHNKREITFSGVLRLEFEQISVGARDSYPVEIYDIHECLDSPECLRWKERLEELGQDNPSVNHVILASSFYRGWGENERLEGISIICTDYTINRL